ncbi:MAG TPA: class I SAM-dependent methyltransferase [Gaiellaceae bacterium]|nr:class I SAM-dependent methyltransferase [Gaiellaceae bacterium]
MTRPLRDHEDAFGRLLLDYLAGQAGQALLERDDGRSGPALPAAVFFGEGDEWPAVERDLFEDASGRVLDIGAGAGRHSLEALRRGLDVVAIDISPGAAETCRRRGVPDVRLLALEDVDSSFGVFDTVLMLCGNFGLAGGRDGTRSALRRLEGLTSPEARILLDTVDPHVECDAADLAYAAKNIEAGRLPGEVTIRIRYGHRATPWFRLLTVSARELEDVVAGTGWRVALVREEPPDVYAALVKERSAVPR